VTPLGTQLIAAAEIIGSAAMQQFRVATLGGRLTLAFAGAGSPERAVSMPSVLTGYILTA
jgi:hypothetical protein